VLSFTARLPGSGSLPDRQWLNLRIAGLCRDIRLGGSFISLATAGWPAATGAQVIENPANRPSAGWWNGAPAREARRYRMPEVAVCEAPEINALATGMN
jgi:hypothetical protein